MNAINKAGTLAELIQGMPTAASTDPQAWCLQTASALPYAYDLKESDNQTVTLDKKDVMRVGITCMGKVEISNYIVSDSFSPCVPVIAFTTTHCYLNHANGASVDKWAALYDSIKDTTLLIVRKTFRNQIAVANLLAKNLADKKIKSEFCDVDIGDTMGIVVYGGTRTLLMYPQID